MKVVINKCFGGFGLSPLAIQRIAERKGLPCYFFRNPRVDGKWQFDKYEPLTLEQATEETLTVHAFRVPDPKSSVFENWAQMTDEQKKAANAVYSAQELPDYRDNRADPDMVAVVEELGSEKASDRLARLAVVEIPDGIEWEIDEYDGQEHIAETHRTWC